jgi:hypothetical protein
LGSSRLLHAKRVKLTAKATFRPSSGDAAHDVIRGGKSEAGAAALLLLPTLLAAYLARPGEHAITARMLRWARFALVADGLLPAFAAYFLVRTSSEASPPTLVGVGPLSFLVGTNGHSAEAAADLEQYWIILAATSLIFVVHFIASNFTPVPHGETVYRPMPRQYR